MNWWQRERDERGSPGSKRGCVVSGRASVVPFPSSNLFSLSWCEEQTNMRRESSTGWSSLSTQWIWAWQKQRSCASWVATMRQAHMQTHTRTCLPFPLQKTPGLASCGSFQTRVEPSPIMTGCSHCDGLQEFGSFSLTSGTESCSGTFLCANVWVCVRERERESSSAP